jgi:hypothetical protein
MLLYGNTSDAKKIQILNFLKLYSLNKNVVHLKHI